MRFNIIIKLVFKNLIRKFLKTRYNSKVTCLILKKMSKKYKELLLSASPLGRDNPMSYNFYIVLYLLSVHLGSPELFTEPLIPELVNYVFNSKIIVRSLKKTNYNTFRSKQKFISKMKQYDEWQKQNAKNYPNTWDFSFTNNNLNGVSFNFTKCPIDLFFRQNNIKHLTKYFCHMDYILARHERGKLIRNYTLATDDKVCDFLIIGDETKTSN